MSSSLIRGKHIVCKAASRTDAQVVDDGAVFQKDGLIVEVGPYRELAAKHQAEEVLGSPGHIVLPGFVNSHHHIGLTPFQLGSPDHNLELWIASRMGARFVDRHLDTLYSAFELVESGVTTVQHLHGWLGGGAPDVIDRAEQILSAYQAIGMRASYSFSMPDQNRFVLDSDERFIRSLPPAVGNELAALLEAVSMPADEVFSVFVELWERWNGSERIRIQLAPANLHWCSDELLQRLHEHALKYQVGLHMHLDETPYQREYARRRTGGSAVGHLHRMGFLGPHLTLGHGVWLNEEDIDLAAATGTMICTNPSSNLRLRSGIAPLQQFTAKGVRVAIGIDEAGINDDRDMLQEMRLVLDLHRTPGMDEAVPTAPEVIRMATENGALTTGFGASIGVLAPGRAADLVLMDWEEIAHPYLHEGTPPLDAVLRRAKSTNVKTVLVAGEAILKEGKFTKVDKQAVLAELADSLRKPLSPDERRRGELGAKLLPHLRGFYAGWSDRRQWTPYYQHNSRR